MTRHSTPSVGYAALTVTRLKVVFVPRVDIAQIQAGSEILKKLDVCLRME